MDFILSHDHPALRDGLLAIVLWDMPRARVWIGFFATAEGFPKLKRCDPEALQSRE